MSLPRAIRTPSARRFSHHQRPARGFSPGLVTRVHGRQPMLEKPFQYSPCRGTLCARTQSSSCSQVQSAAAFQLMRQELPINTPVPKTNAPPKATSVAAESSGVSIKRCRIQVMTASSTRTTKKAMVIATWKLGIKNGSV